MSVASGLLLLAEELSSAGAVGHKQKRNKNIYTYILLTILLSESHCFLQVAPVVSILLFYKTPRFVIQEGNHQLPNHPNKLRRKAGIRNKVGPKIGWGRE